MVRLGSATPILRIFDVAKAREFYTGYLGYAVDWEHRFEPALPLYMQRSRAMDRRCISANVTATALPADACASQRKRLKSYHAELRAKDYGYMRPELGTAPWGERSMTVIDPFGNHISFWEPIESP